MGDDWDGSTMGPEQQWGRTILGTDRLEIIKISKERMSSNSPGILVGMFSSSVDENLNRSHNLKLTDAKL